jgi:hypothetical protein
MLLCSESQIKRIESHLRILTIMAFPISFLESQIKRIERYNAPHNDVHNDKESQIKRIER